MTTRIVPFTDGMKIGLGYDRLSGDRLPSPAVNGPTISAVQGAVGQRVTSDCTIIQDVETLHKSLGISVDAGGAYMGFSGSAKVDYTSSCDFSSFSTYVVVRVSVVDATETIDSPIFSPDANELLVNNNPPRFRQRFGDTFIAGVVKGGEYFAIYQITGSDQSEKESVAVNVQAAYDAGPLASAHLNTDIHTATSTSKSHLEVHVHVFRQGTIGTADLNLEDIIKTAHEFPVGVSGDKAFPYAVLLQDYDGLKNPNDKFNFIDIQNRQDVLADLAKKRFEFLALRDDLKYILKHSDDFQNADGTQVVRSEVSKEFDDVVGAINSMENMARDCSRDATQCKFPTFEVAKYNVPRLLPPPFPKNINAVLLWPNDKAYFFKGEQYFRYTMDGKNEGLDLGYPAFIQGNWPRLAEAFHLGIDTAVVWPNGKAYFFKGDQYVRYNIDPKNEGVDPGYPYPIKGNWPGLGEAFPHGIDAAIVWQKEKAYFFKGEQYAEYTVDPKNEGVLPGYPKPIKGNWPGLIEAFPLGIDAAVAWPNDKVYFFKGGQYVRYTMGSGVDPGYPQSNGGKVV